MENIKIPMHMAIILDGSGRWAKEKGMNRSVGDLCKENFSQFLYNDLPPIDFLIRTSGEARVSNFMLW